MVHFYPQPHYKWPWKATLKFTINGINLEFTFGPCTFVHSSLDIQPFCVPTMGDLFLYF